MIRLSNLSMMSVTDEGYSNLSMMSVTDEGYSNLSMMSVTDEGYSRNTSCAINFISTFLSTFLFLTPVFFVFFCRIILYNFQITYERDTIQSIYKCFTEVTSFRSNTIVSEYVECNTSNNYINLLMSFDLYFMWPFDVF